MQKKITRHERRIEDLAQREAFITERLAGVRDELTVLVRNLDRMVPRPARRRSARKQFVDKVGNLISFPRGQE